MFHNSLHYNNFLFYHKEWCKFIAQILLHCYVQNCACGKESRDPLCRLFLHSGFQSNANNFSYNSITTGGTTRKFWTSRESCAAITSAKFCDDHMDAIALREKLKLYQTGIMCAKPPVLCFNAIKLHIFNCQAEEITGKTVKPHKSPMMNVNRAVQGQATIAT